MQKIIDFLKKYKILKIGSGAAAGSADKLTDLSVGEYGIFAQKNKVTANKKKSTQKTLSSKKKEDFSFKSIEKKTLIIWAIVFLLLWWIFNFGTAFLVILWRFSFIYLAKSSKIANLTAQTLIGLKIGLSIVFLFFTILALASAAPTNDLSGEASPNQMASKEESIKKDAIYQLLTELKEDTGISFKEIKEEELVWPADGISVDLTDSKTMIANEMDENDFYALNYFFSSRGTNSGGIGFEYTAPSGSGYVFMDMDSAYYGIMCVVSNKGYGLTVGCGGGPSYK